MTKNEVFEYGERIARNVTTITLILAILKFIVAYYTHSVSILADSYHSFADLIPISAAWIGLRIAQRPRSEKFPYGYYKAENLAAFIASIFIFLLAYEIITKSISTFSSKNTVEHSIAGLTLTAIFVLISYILYIYQLKAAKISNSQALMANARETKMDIFSSIAVFIGFFGSSMGYPWIGGIVGFLIAILVIHAGYQSIRDSVLSLMDAGLPKEDIEKIRKIILSTPRVREVKKIYTRRSGPFIMVEVEISVPEKLNVKQAHEIASEVEKRIMQIKQVDHAFVHVEPPTKSRKIIAIPVNKDHSPSPTFGSAPYFDIYQVEKDEKKLIKTVKNPGANLEKKRGVKAALFLIEQGVDEVHTKNIGEDSKKILEDAGIKIKFK